VIERGVCYRIEKVQINFIETQNTANDKNQIAPRIIHTTGKINRPKRAKKGTTMFKTVSLTLAAIAASATFAAADTSSLSNFVGEQASANIVELGTVRADAAGVVEVYSYHGGETGVLLGSQKVKAGANSNVRFGIENVGTDAIAILKVGGQVADTQVLEF